MLTVEFHSRCILPLVPSYSTLLFICSIQQEGLVIHIWAIAALCFFFFSDVLESTNRFVSVNESGIASILVLPAKSFVFIITVSKIFLPSWTKV